MSVHVEWKTVETTPNMIWIVMTAIGTIDLPETRAKLTELQTMLDYFRDHMAATHQFTFLFDFSKCRDFAKMAMLGDLKKFMDKNDALMNKSLKESYILLRDPAWEFFVKLVLAFRPKKQPRHLKMRNRALYNALKYNA